MTNPPATRGRALPVAGLSRIEYEARCAWIGREPKLLDRPLEREADLPAWLVPELVATPAARGRLLEWASTGAEDTPTTRATLARRAVVVAEAELRARVGAVLLTLPAAVVDHVARHAVILASGLREQGYYWSGSSEPDDATEARRYLLAVWRGDGEEFAGTVAHEIAHHWCEPARSRTEPARDYHATLEARDNLVSYAASVGSLDYVVRQRTEPEVRAARLTTAWGYSGACASERVQILATRQRVELEAALLARARGA